MQDLRLIGVHEDGLHLLLAGPDGEHYTVPIDDALRTSARRDRPRMGQLQIDIDGGMRPREVQSLIRAGGSTEEVADRAGWSVDKVRRYEVPILAERAHVADQARLVRVRHRGGAAAGAAPTLQGRVAQRMRERGVEPDANSWDAWRAPEATSWTVVLTFAAGGRQRQASWVFDPVLRSAEALDDEARWLSADEVAAAGPLPTTPARAASVYDVEAEGGVAATTRRAAAGERGGGERPGGDRAEEPVDLMTAMRQRTTVGRRSGRRRAEPRRADAAPALPLDDTSSDTGDTGGREVVREGQGPRRRGHVEPVLPGEIAELEPAGSEVAPLGDIEDGGDTEPDQPTADETSPDETLPQSGPGDDAADPADVVEEADSAAADVDAESDPPTLSPTPSPIDEPPEPAAGATDDVTDRADEAEEAEPVAATTPVSKRKARTSVPSWDDIMFGAKRD